MRTLIVYIHGALSSKHSWAYMRSKIIVDTYQCNDVLLEYDIRMEASKDTVDRFVKCVKRKFNESVFKPERIIFVGHSFGGILAVSIARELKDYLDERNVNFQILSLSAPYGGSGLASLMRIIRPFSVFLKNIGSNDSFMRKFRSLELPCPVTAIVTTKGNTEWHNTIDNDGVVTIESQMYYHKIDPNFKAIKFDCNHFEVLLRDKPVEILMEMLK